MIIVRLKGGLGNQMFEYAAGLALALKTGSKLFFDSTFLNDRTPLNYFTFRKYELGIFNVRARFTFLSRLSFVIRIPLLWPALSIFIEKAGKAFGSKTIYLKDYFQSEKYFHDYVNTVREDFTFKDQLSVETEKIAAEIESTESVCIHVRRGDYVNDEKTTAYHVFVGDSDYYHLAIRTIEKKVRNPRFFIFSDDIAWCRTNIETTHLTTYVSVGFEDFRLMALCKHDIIANSSFSWWAAWLNGNHRKIVIAPKSWFRKEQEREGGIVPENWIRL